MATKDLWMGNSVSNISIREHITPHKIAVVILIQEYCNIKSEAIRQAKYKTEESFIEVTQKMPEPCYRRDFCMLILHLIQCPDMDCRQLVTLLESNKYKIVPGLLQNFLKELEKVINKEVGTFMDVILNLGRLLIDPINLTPLVNRSSSIGVYLRRVMLFFDKLNFSQTLNLYRRFQHYVLLFKNPQGIKTKNNLCDSLQLPAVTSPSNGLAPLSPFTPVTDLESVNQSINMDLSSVVEQVVPPSSSIIEEIEHIKFPEENLGPLEEVPALWSRRQAELFIARQSNWLQNNEQAALPPPQLQEVIRKVLLANPDHFEAHFLSYLNCLRVKEFSGALDSLHHYFDRSAVSSQDKEAKGYRYAALNLAIHHAQFGHKSEALAALKEAIFLSHEANDNICLQHIQAWLYKLTDKNKEVLMERSISKCSDLSLNYLTSLGLQSFAQFAGTTGGKPALVFEVLMRSDVLNCQFSLGGVAAAGLAHKSALWTLYGKADMATLTSQLLLHLDTHSAATEPTCHALSNVALRLTELGEYELATVVVDHAKEKFPTLSSWQLAEQIIFFTRSLSQGKWQAAHAAVRQLTTLDKWEALLREGELLLWKGDAVGALAAVTAVLDGGPALSPAVRVRALLLTARGSPAAAVSILTAALSIANYHYLDYLTALVAMELASLQLQMNLPGQALKLMDQSLLVVLSHGGYYDQATALLLFVKCKVASAALAEPDLRSEVIADAIRLLTKVRDNFQHVEAYSKLKEAVYLQSLLANELGCYGERNKFAYEFRQLDEEFPTSLQV